MFSTHSKGNSWEGMGFIVDIVWDKELHCEREGPCPPTPASFLAYPLLSPRPWPAASETLTHTKPPPTAENSSPALTAGVGSGTFTLLKTVRIHLSSLERRNGGGRDRKSGKCRKEDIDEEEQEMGMESSAVCTAPQRPGSLTGQPCKGLSNKAWSRKGRKPGTLYLLEPAGVQHGFAFRTAWMCSW